MELFVPTLLRNFLLKKSDFLGIFKNVLTGFYCTSKYLSYMLFVMTYHKLQTRSKRHKNKTTNYYYEKEPHLELSKMKPIRSSVDPIYFTHPGAQTSHYCIPTEKKFAVL
jgi:hypothetical protein